MEGAQMIMTAVIIGFIIIGAIVALLVWVFRMWLHQQEVKNYVDVIVYHVGKHFNEWERFNCHKKKKISDSNLYSIELVSKKASRSFPFEEEFAIKRKIDGKTTVLFVELDGLYVPFLPDAKITTNHQEKIVEKTITDDSNIVSSVKDMEKTFGDKHLRDIAYTELKNDFNLFKFNPKQGSVPWFLFLVIAGIAVVAIVLILLFGKKKTTTG